LSDGYLGWSLGLAMANRTDWNVVLADKLIKREWKKERWCETACSHCRPLQKRKQYKKNFGKSNLSFEKIDLPNEKARRSLSQSIALCHHQRPRATVAPFSMMNGRMLQNVSNNVVSHLNVLFAIAEIDKSIKYIKTRIRAVATWAIDTDRSRLRKRILFQRKWKSPHDPEQLMPMHAT